MTGHAREPTRFSPASPCASCARAACAIDNVLSHAEEVASFLALLARDPTLARATVAVGKGLHLAWRRPATLAAPGALA